MSPPVSIDGDSVSTITIDGQEAQTVTLDGNTVFSAGPRSTYLAYGTEGAEGTVYIHEVGGGFPVVASPLSNQREGGILSGLSFSPDNSYLAFGTTFNKIYIHDVGGDFPLNTTITGLDTDCEGGIRFSPDNSLVAFASNAGGVRVHEVGNGFPLKHVISPTSFRTQSGVSFSPDNSYLAYGDNNGSVFVHDVESGFPLNTELTQAGSIINGLQFSPDNSILAYGSADETVYFHDVGNGFPKSKSFNKEQGHEINSPVISAISFTSDNKFIAYGTANGNCYVRNFDNFLILETTLGGVGDNIRTLDFSRGDDYLMLGGEDRVRIYDVPSFSLNTTLKSVRILSYGNFNSVTN